jgi:hypothetical protein
MARRDDDQAFGSDSFLDVVANVVGILIILIVIVGVRVGRTPVLAILPELPPAIETPLPPAAEPVVEPEPEPVFVASLIEPPAPPPQPRVIVVEKPLPELPTPQAPAALVTQSETLRREIDQFAEARAKLEQDVQAAGRRVTTTQSQLEARATAVAVASNQAEREQAELAAGERELAATLDQLQRLRQMLAETDAEPAATTIQHRVTPIGRAVTGAELHFHLSQGRVAFVPVDDLARRLRTQIERQKALYTKVERYEGAVDPLDGFRMHYVIERNPLSFQEELKFGQNVVRMQVSQWIIQPEPALESESAEAALQRGSRFYQALMSAGRTTTLTFWVYPDSFELCGQLKEFAQQHGYDVAARPLPFGVPIAGSPSGSKSIAQ